MKNSIFAAALAASVLSVTLHASEPCQAIHGRAHYYYGDGQFRIWHIGTHHEFSLASEDDSGDPRGGVSTIEIKMLGMLRVGIKEPVEISDNDLFADFVVCPVEPYRKGAAQAATVRSMHNARVVHTPENDQK